MSEIDGGRPELSAEAASAVFEAAEPAAIHEDEKFDEKEEAPVIDVHVPHATHTWKDFWIHLGTITIGLLIAIGLEQSVEALHRLQLRHELEAALHAECEHNRESAENNFQVFDDHLAWLLGLRRDIDTMIATGGKANLPYRVLKSRPRMSPGELILRTAVWDTVKDNDRLLLLPDEVARVYSADYKQVQFVADLRAIANEAHQRQAAFEMRFADLETPETPVLSRMNREQLEEYAMLVSQSFAAVTDQKGRLVNFMGVNNATLKGGVYDSAGIIAEQIAAGAAHPKDFKKLAAQSAPEAKDGR